MLVVGLRVGEAVVGVLVGVPVGVLVVGCGVVGVAVVGVAVGRGVGDEVGWPVVGLRVG